MTAFHQTYRPQNLDSVIGHVDVVTRLKGMIAGNKIPNALFFMGPTSAGKTTLARAFAAGVNGLDSIGESRDYTEINAAEARTIDDVRQMLQQAKFRPQHRKRVVMVDEVQNLVTNKVAADAFLKPLEEPSKDTIWILASMDPSKFQSGSGKAIANRCSQFVLEPHTPSDLLKQATRIAKAEKMTYVMDEERTVLKQVVRSCQEMRTLANLMESLQQYYEGLSKKPKLLTAENVSSVLASTESNDDKLAVALLEAVYKNQFKIVQRSLLDVSDSFQFITILLRLSNYVLNTMILEGARHPKVWASPAGKELVAKSKGVTLGKIAAVHATLVEVKSKASAFSVDAIDLISASMYRVIKEAN